MGCNSWGVGMQCRWEKGLRLGLRLGLGEVERKRKKNEKNTTKGQNVFHFIPFKITQLEKAN